MKKLVMSLAAALMLCVIGTIFAAEGKQEEVNKTKQRLEKIIIPSFDIDDASIKIAVRFLQKIGKRSDPDGVGVNIILKTSDNAANKIISLSVKKKSLYEIISILCKNAGLKFHIKKDAVVIH